MSFLSRIKAAYSAATQNPGPTDDFWYEPLSPASSAGIRVTADVALKATAVYACVKILAETIASLPIHMFRVTSDGRTLAPNHRLQELLQWQPNAINTAHEFWEMLVVEAALEGTAYAEIVPGPNGAVSQLIPLQTRHVKPEKTSLGLRFKVTDPKTGIARMLLPEELLRIPGIPRDGVSGLRAVELAGDAIGLGLAADQYAARVFSNDLNIGTAIIHPSELSPEAQRNLIHKLMQRFSGAKNSHRPMLLTEGMKVEKIGQNATEAQLEEARTFQIKAVARVFRIPDHMLWVRDSQPRANVEQDAIGFVRYTIRPWLTRIEQALRRDLLTEDEKGKFFAEFALDGLLRGDSKTRAEFYGKMVQWGIMTRNEARKLESLPPIDGLDDPLTPSNMMIGFEEPEPEPEPEAPLALEPPEEAPDEEPDPKDKARAFLRKEIVALRKAARRFAGDDAAFRQYVIAFFGGHTSTVMEQAEYDKANARIYCDTKRDMIINADDPEAVLKSWEDQLEKVLSDLSEQGMLE